MKQKLFKDIRRALMLMLTLMIVGGGVALIFSVAYAQQSGIIPCGETLDAQGNITGTPCNLCHFLVLGQNIINFIIGPGGGGVQGLPVGIIYPIAVLMIGYGGFIWFTSGGSQTRLIQAKGIIYSAVVGLAIGLASFLIVNTVLNVLAGQGISNTTAQPTGFPWPWNDIQCKALPGGVAQLPGGVAPGPIGAAINAASPELNSFLTCMSQTLPAGVGRTTSVADNNIASGACSPFDPNERFLDPNNCNHVQNSCHYGGNSATCRARGSYAIDYGDQQNYTAIRQAAILCGQQLGLFAQPFVAVHSNNHVHVSIGVAYGCGCN